MEGKEFLFFLAVISLLLLSFIGYYKIANAQEPIGVQEVPVTDYDNQSQVVPWIGLTRLINITDGIANILGMNEPGIANELAISYGMKEPTGILVRDVEIGSPAEKAGIRGGNKMEFIETEIRAVKLGGDVIIRADNKTITNRANWDLLTRDKKIGDDLQLTIFRDGQIKQANIKVGSRPGLLYENASVYTNATNVHLTPYENVELGIEIQSPPNWRIQESEDEGSIIFRTLPENKNDTTQEYLKIALVGAYLYPNITQAGNVTGNLKHLRIIEPVHNITLANNPASKTIFSFTDVTVGDLKTLKIATQKNDKIFLISYYADQTKFSDYLPTIEEMIGSFKILDMSLYENITLGIRMKYPSNWREPAATESYSEATFSSGYEIMTLPLNRNNSNSFEGYIKIFVSDPYGSPSTAKEDFDKTVYNYKNRTYPNFKLLNSTSTNSGNNQPSHNITYSYGDPKFGIIITKHFITIQNDRIYSVSYALELKEYLRYLAPIDKILDSIEFFKPRWYINPISGVILQYPSDWNVDEPNIRTTVRFSPSSMSSELVINTCGIGNSSCPNSSLHSYNASTIGKGSISKTSLYTTSKEPFPANKTVFTYQQPVFNSQNREASYTDVLGNNLYGFTHVYAEIKNKAYDITYFADVDTYDDYLLTTENILNSIRIILPSTVREVNSNNPRETNYTYYNSPFGFKILHPLEWQPLNYSGGYIQFEIPQPNNIQPFEDYPRYLNIRVTPFVEKETEYYDIIESDIAYYGQLNDFEQIESRPISDTRYLFAYRSADTISVNLYIYNSTKSNIYTLSYSDTINNFFNYFPIIDQSIDSFDFIKSGREESRSPTGFKVGDYPLGIAINPITNMVYVANLDSDLLSIINGSDDKILGNIKVKNDPTVVAVDKFRNTVYVAHPHSISVIDGRSNTLMSNISINSSEPVSIAINPSTRRLYVADVLSANVSVIDTGINKEIDVISSTRSKSYDPSSEPGIGVAIDSPRNRLYVGDSQGNITVIDGEDNKILHNISEPNSRTLGAHDITINHLTNKGYFVSGGSIEEIDLRTYETRPIDLTTYETPIYEYSFLTINPISNKIYVVDRFSNTVHVIDLANKNIESITVDSAPTYAAFNQDTKTVYVTNSDSDTVSKIDGEKDRLMVGLRFNITPLDSIDNAIISCEDNEDKNLEFLHDSYISDTYGTDLKCKAQSKNIFSPLISSSWHGVDYSDPRSSGFEFKTQNQSFIDPQMFLDLAGLVSNLWFGFWHGTDYNNPSVEFNMDRYTVLDGTITDLGSLMQRLSPAISIGVLIVVVLASSMPSILGIRRSSRPQTNTETNANAQASLSNADTQTEEILSRSDVITINASVIAGVLVFLSILEGFERTQQTQISFITANIVFPFAISAILAITKRYDFALRLMVAGFINLMISVILIALMRL